MNAAIIRPRTITSIGKLGIVDCAEVDEVDNGIETVLVVTDGNAGRLEAIRFTS